MKNYTVAFLLTFGLLSSEICFAGFSEGMAAYNQYNYETTLKEWLPLAKHGNADAQFGMGMMYEKGQGLPRDDSQALSWYKKSAKQGHALAMERLGWMYKNGYETEEGIKKNSHNALYYFKEASNRGLVESTLAAAGMYENGIENGTNGDFGMPIYPEAYRWYKKAKSQGSLTADSSIERLFSRCKTGDNYNPYTDKKTRLPGCDELETMDQKEQEEARAKEQEEFNKKHYKAAVEFQEERMDNVSSMEKFLAHDKKMREASEKNERQIQDGIKAGQSDVDKVIAQWESMVSNSTSFDSKAFDLRLFVLGCYQKSSQITVRKLAASVVEMGCKNDALTDDNAKDYFPEHYWATITAHKNKLIVAARTSLKNGTGLLLGTNIRNDDGSARKERLNETLPCGKSFMALERQDDKICESNPLYEVKILRLEEDMDWRRVFIKEITKK